MIRDWLDERPQWQVVAVGIVLGILGLSILQLSFEILRERDQAAPATEPEPAAETTETPEQEETREEAEG